MSLDQSPVSTTIDFDRDGKQATTLRVPYSRNNSAWGAVLVPVVCIKHGCGPTVLFVGGNHGGEYEGPVALLKLARALEPEQIQGRVIILPAMNLPAVQAAQRISPIDHLDMNRTFPGKYNGTVTQIIAHYVHEAILPLADAVIDLHAGGYSLDLLPYNSMHFLPDPQLTERTMAALKAFDAPVSLVMREFTGEGLLDYAVEGMGKIFLCAEIGGAGRLTPETVKIAETGVQNLLKHFGIIKGQAPASKTRLMEIPEPEYYAYAASQGIYEAFFPLGCEVGLGQPLGQIHYPEDPERNPETIVARRAGTLVGTRGPGFVEPGDCVAAIAKDLDQTLPNGLWQQR
jgi:N2-acetyl-L-2,4-diaminobutanoate deacetylase